MIKVKSEHSDSIATACVCACMRASFKHARTSEDCEYTPCHIEILLLKCLWLKHVATTLWSVARVETGWDSPLPRSKTISNTCLILFWSRHTVPDNTGCWAEWSREFRGDDCHGSSSPIFHPCSELLCGRRTMGRRTLAKGATYWELAKTLAALTLSQLGSCLSLLQVLHWVD